MTIYYVIDGECALVVAAFVNQRTAERYADCALSDGLVFTDVDSLKALYEQRPALRTELEAHHMSRNAPDLMAHLEASLPRLKRKHYGVRESLIDLFEKPVGQWRLTELIEKCRCPRITVACQLTEVKKLGKYEIELGKDKYYHVRKKQDSQTRVET